MKTMNMVKNGLEKNGNVRMATMITENGNFVLTTLGEKPLAQCLYTDDDSLYSPLGHCLGKVIEQVLQADLRHLNPKNVSGLSTLDNGKVCLNGAGGMHVVCAALAAMGYAVEVSGEMVTIVRK